MSYFHQYHTEPQIIHNQKICFAPHLHNEVEIIALFQGSAALTADGDSYSVDAGDFLVIFPNTIHSYTLEKNVDVGKFIFNPADMPELDSVFKTKRPVSPVIKYDIVSKSGLNTLAKEILLHYKTSSPPVQKAYLLLLAGKLLELCEFKEYKSLNDNIITGIFDYCKNNFRSDITLDDVAKALFVSKSYISHIFCCKLKINFRSYINSLRIKEAALLLRQNNLTITEISEQSGFGSIRTFNRAFLSHMGVTPKMYKNSLLTQTEELFGRNGMSAAIIPENCNKNRH